MAYSNSQVAHNFAHRTGKKQNGSNMFYEIHENGTATIYSYGYHFALAHILNENTVVITSESYSVSTNKHACIVLSAISHFENIIDVPFEVGKYFCFGSEIKKKHVDSVRYYENIIEQLRAKHLRAKKHSYIGSIANILETMHEFCSFFYCFDLVSKNHAEFFSSSLPITHEKVLDYYFNEDEIQSLRDKEQRLKEQEKQRKKIEAKKLSEAIEKFRNREIHHVHGTSFAYLRYNDSKNVLETSKGMTVEINKQLSILYDMMKNGKELKEPITIEGFRVDSVTPKFIKIGCHTISIDEADRVAQYITQ